MLVNKFLRPLLKEKAPKNGRCTCKIKRLRQRLEGWKQPLMGRFSALS
jgi:hypothetical protein